MVAMSLPEHWTFMTDCYTENMEMTYGNSKFVDAVAGGICCYGDGEMDRPIALMQLNQAVAMQWAKENGVEGDFEVVLKSK
jgi:long-chain acyl-CoA synthetase